MEYTANKFSDFEKVIRKLGHRYLSECQVLLVGRAIVYDWRENILGKRTLKPFGERDVNGFRVLSENSFHRSVIIGLQQDVTKNTTSTCWLSSKSFPINFLVNDLPTNL